VKRFAVIGLSTFGYYLTKSLFDAGHEVIAIDQDRQRIQSISSSATQAVILNATDKEQLRSLGLESMDSVIISTGTNLSASVLIAFYLKEMGVKHIIAKALDEDHSQILEKLGVNEVIQPERDMAFRLAKSLISGNILDYVPLDDNHNLIQFAAPASFQGKSLKDLDLRARYNINVIAIEELVPYRFILAPTADFILKESDILIVLGASQDIEKFQKVK